MLIHNNTAKNELQGNVNHMCSVANFTYDEDELRAMCEIVTIWSILRQNFIDFMVQLLYPIEFGKQFLIG